MSDPETRSKREKKMKRNPIAKELLDRKGPFSLKVVNPKKNEYRRVKLDPRNIQEEDYNDE